MSASGKRTQALRRALVVDDDADIRSLLVHILDGNGVACVEADDAERALEIARSSEIDLLVTDICLPGMSGAELGWRLREEHPSLPVVAVTAHLGAWDRDDLADLGFDATVRKPLHIATFIGVCLAALSGADAALPLPANARVGCSAEREG
jgi:CheY-like chemotaxis protein